MFMLACRAPFWPRSSIVERSPLKREVDGATPSEAAIFSSKVCFRRAGPTGRGTALRLQRFLVRIQGAAPLIRGLHAHVAQQQRRLLQIQHGAGATPAMSTSSFGSPPVRPCSAISRASAFEAEGWWCNSTWGRHFRFSFSCRTGPTGRGAALRTQRFPVQIRGAAPFHSRLCSPTAETTDLNPEKCRCESCHGLHSLRRSKLP